MSIPTLDTDLSIIQKLDDYPNDIGGLSAAQLKAKFDEGVLALQTYINTVLIPALIASNVSFTPTAAINAETVQAAIENVQAQLAGISAGTIPNNTVGMEKLTKTVQNAIASGGGAAAAVTALSETVAQNVAATDENTTAIAAINTANVNRDVEIAKIGDKAEKSQGATFVLTAAGWTEGKQTVAINIGSGRNDAVGLDTSATLAQWQEAAKCGVKVYSANEEGITFSCETVPTLDLPCAYILIEGGRTMLDLFPKQISPDETAINTKLGRTTAVTEDDTNYTSYMARGQSLNSADTTPTKNGQIAWQYE